MPNGSGTPATACGLRHTFADGTVALDGIDLEVEPGELLAVVGANGSGKSTLLRVLAGALAPQGGEVRVFGLDPAKSDPRIRRRVAWLSQELALDPEMRGHATLRFFAALHGLTRRAADARIAELARLFELDQHLTRRVDAYSGGLRQRLHLAIALLGAPELLLLDEPTARLDSRMRSVVEDRIARDVRGGWSAVLVTHDLVWAKERATRIAILSRGKLVAIGGTTEIAGCAAFAALSLQARQ